MALKRLTKRQMVALTRTWVDPRHRDHQVFMARPMLAACMPKIRGVHQGLLAVLTVADYQRTLQELIDEQGEAGDGHNGKVRGIWYRLLAAEMLAANEDEKDACRRLRAVLLPAGLATNNFSYTDKVGHAEMVSERLEPEDERFLERIPTIDGHLGEAVKAWLALADEIGVLEHRRASLEAASADRQSSAEARNAWVRVITHVRKTAELEDVDAELSKVLDRVARAERLAEERAARRADVDVDGEPEPVVDDDAEPDADADEDADAMVDGDADAVVDGDADAVVDAEESAADG